MKGHALYVLSTDKEGGRALVSHGLFNEKGLEAVTKAFASIKSWSVSRAKTEASKLCNGLELVSVKGIEQSKWNCLEAFFSVKTPRLMLPSGQFSWKTSCDKNKPYFLRESSAFDTLIVQ